VAIPAPREGVRNLWVAPLDDLQAARPVTQELGRGISSFFQWAFTHRHLVFFQDQEGDENWRASSVDIVSGAIVPLTPVHGVRSHRQEVSPHFPTTMLFGHNQLDKRYHDLYRVNIVTGAAELLYENTEFTSLITDTTFVLRLGTRVQPNGDVAWLERRADGSWQELWTVPTGDVDMTRLLGFSADGTTLYLLDSRGRDKAALVAFDMAHRTAHILAEDAEADLTDVVFSTDTRVPRAAGGAALTAATKTPEVFACIVDVFGIANLLTFMAAIPPYWQPWFAVWKQRLGDPDTEAGRAWLTARSSLTHVDRAVRPILIAQGLQDVRVTRAESEQMVAALQARRVPVTYITFTDEGHGFVKPANQIAFRAVTEAFLVTHLGGTYEPINQARDFRGSSLMVEAGADLVPGLARAR
jgi:dipeptidyl aminopeptidase/acylaminoacyl peptidase